MQDRIYGDRTPVVELVLNPGEVVKSWAADAAWMTEFIDVNPPGEKGDKSWLGRLFSRGSNGADQNLMVTFQAGRDPGMVAFATRLPGEVVVVDLRPDPAMEYICAADALMCVEEDVQVTVVDPHALGSGLYGKGFSLLSLAGIGRAWVGLAGTVVSYELRPEEVIRVHPGHLGMVHDSVTIDVAEISTVRTPSFPDGLRLLELTGPGRVWLTSLGVGPVAEAIDDFSFPAELVGRSSVPPPRQRGVIREALFPRSK